jgi:hypothetical protein
MSFGAFVLRARVLSQYRDFMRALARAPAPANEDLKKQVRHAFRNHSTERNTATIKQLLAEGTKQLAFARAFASSANGGVPSDSGGSWVGTGEVWDVRGRVGTDWPWGGSEKGGST